MAARSASVAKPCAFSTAANFVIGSRVASSARSAGVLYSFSSSDSECEYGRDDLGVDQRRTLARAAVRHGVRHRPVALEDVGAVAPEHVQAGE